MQQMPQEREGVEGMEVRKTWWIIKLNVELFEDLPCVRKLSKVLLYIVCVCAFSGISN